MTRNLVEHRLTDAQAASIDQAMRLAFEEAEIDAGEIERLEPAMTNEAKDRHVLAAAVAADSELVVTFNLDDFPPEVCEPVGVEAVHPDDFLLDLHDLAPEAVRAAGRPRERCGRDHRLGASRSRSRGGRAQIPRYAGIAADRTRSTRHSAS
jgi:hypothetical protein